jgi:hypothetical protein
MDVDFLFDVIEQKPVRYFGCREPAWKEIRIHGRFSCAGLGFAIEAFDDGSELRRTDESYAGYCGSLKSNCIPHSVQILGEMCLGYCEIKELRFEGQSGQKRIETFCFEIS